ncbi:alpha/beta hydrolase [Chachezhania sediminis]|uniref:alpha/beta hydrolase n=1 Tax=Chachezhania sediminis TaxID=2599291 RepID=UPI00131B84C4|nr:alpha/beta hydrolase [Chachezhania sediminis]
MTPAPFFDDVAGGPPGGQAWWLDSADGVRIRIAVWRPDGPARATILLFPGRTEHCEKYGIVADAFVARGYAVLAVDWRGQGLADRALPNRLIGHIDHFPDFQHDVKAVIAGATELDLPQPRVLLGHSMGGAIGMRAMTEGLDVAAAVFTGPMWGIQIGPRPLRVLADVLTSVAPALGLGGLRAPTSPTDNMVLVKPFEGNTLTSDPQMFDHMKRQLEAHHDLSLGGPSLNWLGAALAEIDAIQAMAAPDAPCLTLAGACEQIADLDMLRTRAENWPGCQFELVPGAQHEILFETPEVRQMLHDRIDAFYSAHIA